MQLVWIWGFICQYSYIHIHTYTHTYIYIYTLCTECLGKPKTYMYLLLSHHIISVSQPALTACSRRCAKVQTEFSCVSDEFHGTDRAKEVRCLMKPPGDLRLHVFIRNFNKKLYLKFSHDNDIWYAWWVKCLCFCLTISYVFVCPEKDESRIAGNKLYQHFMVVIHTENILLFLGRTSQPAVIRWCRSTPHYHRSLFFKNVCNADPFVDVRSFFALYSKQKCWSSWEGNNKYSKTRTFQFWKRCPHNISQHLPMSTCVCLETRLVLSKKPKEEVGVVEMGLGCSRHEWNLDCRAHPPGKSYSVEKVEPFVANKFP